MSFRLSCWTMAMAAFAAAQCLAQCETEYSHQLNISQKNTLITAFPGVIFLPRPNPDSLESYFNRGKFLLTQGRSGNPACFSNSSALYAQAPAKTDIFFGGDDPSNGHANTQVVYSKVFNLHSGPVKIKGTFYSRSSAPNFNESYLGILPANYNYYAPIDADPGMSGSGLNSREGIIIGAVNGSGNAFLIDHRNSQQSSSFIKGPVASGLNFSKWFTMEAVFEIKNKQLYLTSATYDDGSTKQPLGSNILIGAVANYSWLDSFVFLAGVDDMLAEVSIEKLKCEGCAVQDSVVYDLTRARVKRIPTPIPGKVKPVDFNQINKPWVVEAMENNDSFFANSNQCFTSSFSRPTVYFAGDKPSLTAGNPACISGKSLYNIYEGPLIVEADFFNRQDVAESNEMYLGITPPDFTYYKAWSSGNNDELEGIRVGARPYASMVTDAGNSSAPDRVIKTLQTHNKASNGKWFRMKSGFDIVNDTLRLFTLEIDAGGGYSKVYTQPVKIGPVSAYDWLDKARVTVLADDMVDSIRILKRICHSTLKPCLVNHSDFSFCKGKDSFDLSKMFRVNTLPPANAQYKLISFNNLRNHPNLSAYPLSGKGQLSKNRPSGKWEVQMISSCGAKDSGFVTIKDEPIISIYPKTNPILCSKQRGLAEIFFIDSVNVKGGNWKWIGSYIQNDTLKPIRSADSILTRNLAAKGIYTSAQGCLDSIQVIFTVRNAPELGKLMLSRPAVCVGDSVGISAAVNPDKKLLWAVHNSSDGLLSVLSTTNIRYKHGKTDAQEGKAGIQVRTEAVASDPCPIVMDSVWFKIVSYPLPHTSDSIRVCAPAAGSLVGYELNKKKSSDLIYSWKTSNGITQTGDRLFYNFNQQANISITLTITDTTGACSTAIYKPNWIQVNPKPKAAFVPDPADYKMVPGAEFRFVNTSSVDQTLFRTSITGYNWDLIGLRFQQQSVAKEPVFAVPDDTAAYAVRLIATTDKGCKDTNYGKVFAISRFEVYMPTSFSPDDEGTAANNKYMIFALNYRSFVLKIYSRWGELLFETNSLQKGWDGKYGGKECPDGVFVALAEVKDMAGYTHIYKQAVTLLR